MKNQYDLLKKAAQRDVATSTNRDTITPQMRANYRETLKEKQKLLDRIEETKEKIKDAERTYTDMREDKSNDKFVFKTNRERPLFELLADKPKHQRGSPNRDPNRSHPPNSHKHPASPITPSNDESAFHQSVNKVAPNSMPVIPDVSEEVEPSPHIAAAQHSPLSSKSMKKDPVNPDPLRSNIGSIDSVNLPHSDPVNLYPTEPVTLYPTAPDNLYPTDPVDLYSVGEQIISEDIEDLVEPLEIKEKVIEQGVVNETRLPPTPPPPPPPQAPGLVSSSHHSEKPKQIKQEPQTAKQSSYTGVNTPIVRIGLTDSQLSFTYAGELEMEIAALRAAIHRRACISGAFILLLVFLILYY